MLKTKHAINDRVWLSFLTLIVTVLFSFSAQAACSTPTGSAGEMYYNTTDDVMQYCDDTNWIDMGPNPGAGGGGCSTPTGTAGEMLYNSTVRAMQYCDGGSWNSMGTEIVDPGTSNLVAHWEFEETSGTTADDSMGNSDNDGTLQTGVSWSTDSVVGSGSILLDGVGYVDLANADAVGAVSDEATFTTTGDYQTITISAWTKVTHTDTSDWDGIFGKIAGINYAQWAGGTAGNRIMRGMTRNDDAGTSNYFPASIGTMTVDEWIHTVFVVDDGVGYKVYFDGVLDRDVSFSNINADHWGCASGGCNIGVFNTADTHKFEGNIDDFRVYDGELTEAEILYLYDLGASGGCTSPAGTEGEMLYNSTDDAMEYCNGLAWVSIGK